MVLFKPFQKHLFSLLTCLCLILISFLNRNKPRCLAYVGLFRVKKSHIKQRGDSDFIARVKAPYRLWPVGVVDTKSIPRHKHQLGRFIVQRGDGEAIVYTGQVHQADGSIRLNNGPVSRF